MAIPDYQTLMLPVLRAAAEQEKKVADVADQIADQIGLSSEDRAAMLPSGRQRLLHNRIHWSKFYLTKAGLIRSPSRGRFVATEEGRKLLATNPERINVPLLMKLPAFKDWYVNQGEAGPEGAEALVDPKAAKAANVTPEEQIESAYQAVQSALRSDLLERISQNSPSFFEQLIVDLLIAMDYGGSRKSTASQLTGHAGDGGIDGIINEDRLGLDRIYVQAKRYAKDHPVGRPEVQAFVGSLVGRGATKGVFVTTSTFSPQARDYVLHLTQRVILVDGESLADLMIEHGVGVRKTRAIEFKRLDEDFLSEDE
jgi:restriction system protein